MTFLYRRVLTLVSDPPVTALRPRWHYRRRAWAIAWVRRRA